MPPHLPPLSALCRVLLLSVILACAALASPARPQQASGPDGTTLKRQVEEDAAHSGNSSSKTASASSPALNIPHRRPSAKRRTASSSPCWTSWTARPRRRPCGTLPPAVRRASSMTRNRPLPRRPCACRHGPGKKRKRSSATATPCSAASLPRTVILRWSSDSRNLFCGKTPRCVSPGPRHKRCPTRRRRRRRASFAACRPAKRPCP